MNRSNITYTIVFQLVIFFTGCESKPKQLDIYGARETVQKIVDGKKVIDTLYSTIPDFRLLNQDSTYITNKMFDGKIYVADFFFTSCPSICPIMHKNMLSVYNQFKDNNRILCLSHSIDFKNDTPSVLKQYSKRLGVQNSRWQFVTGSKEQIYPLAEKNYLTDVTVDKRVPGGFAHSGYLILVDGQRRIRGAYMGTCEDEAKRLSADIEVLLKEQY
jgi:protein SCO1/2